MTSSADNFKNRITCWSDLADLIEHFSFYTGHDWLFRGVTDETHGLVPKIGRPETRAQQIKSRKRIPYRKKDEEAVLSMFAQQSRAYINLPYENELQQLAIAGHFGLPTRLLDWTDNLLVAAWFAVEKAGAKAPNAAIWVTRAVPSVDARQSKTPLSIKEPLVYRPHHISPRIAAQGSVLMICPEPTKELALPHTKKIIIDKSAEFTIKKRLNACGINKRYLFPDLTGLSEHLAWLYKRNYLAGYKNNSKGEGTPDLLGETD